MLISSTSRHWKLFNWMALVTIFGWLSTGHELVSRAQDAAEKVPVAPLGQFITVSSPVDANIEGKVRRIAKDLQSRAQQEGRKAILVLEITDGPSRFGDVRELAQFLSSAIPSVTTVAWIPKDVRGYNVILALACNEIVMAPKASLGDIGRGKAVEADAQSFVVNLVNRRHNTKLSEALVLGMMDPQKEVLWVRLKVGDPAQAVTETRVVTAVEFERLVKGRAVIDAQQTIKAAGTDGMFTGTQSRALNILVTQTADSLADIATLYKLPREALRDDPAAGSAPVARRIRIEGVITPLVDEFIQRQIKRAVSSGANLLIFEIESPGGYLHSSKNLAYAISDLDPKEVRTVAYIPDEALSGAAIIALGADEIYMHPSAKLGDAGPIEMQKGGAFERADEKILSVLRQDLKDLAERKGRPPALAMAMADKDLLVYEVTNRDSGNIWYMSDAEIHDSNGEWIKGRVVPESEKNLLLTVDGRRAHALKLAAPPVDSFDELKQRLGVPVSETLPAIGATWVDSLVFYLNTSFVTGLLFVIGIMCIYAELHVTSGFFAICATLCFSLFFWSRFLGGTADWLEVVLFLIGLGCIAMEIFVVPGFGIFGISGGLLVISSLVLASQTFYIPVSRSDYQELSRSVGTLSGAIVGFIILAVFLGRYLPRMPLLNEMVLVPPGGADREHWNEPQLRPEYSGARTANPRLEQSPELIGRVGKTTTILRPSGKALIDEKYLDVISDGPFIDQGTAVEVIAVAGNKIVVRQV
jgi:membrane-bound serine protease (ClpP class)